MTVYADVLFLVNFSLDYVSLYITGRLLSQPMKTRRLCLASSLGAVYAVAALFLDVPEAIYITVTLLVSGLMCVCAFKRRGVLGTVGASVLLFSVGCTLGGAMTAVYSLGAGYRESLGGGEDNSSAAVFIIVAAVATGAVYIGSRVLSRRRGVGSAHVTVTVQGRTATFDALADSGNLLRDPASGKPALVISRGAAGRLLPEEAVSASLSDDPASAAKTLPADVLCRVRLLPVSNVYGRGMLLGYRPDSVTVSDGSGGGRDVDCILAVSSGKEAFGGFDGVLPAEFS